MKSQKTAENVLIIVLDTVRAKSSYVAGRDLTPGLARVADRGISFEYAITPAPWTFPAHASMFTGKYPTEHGATQMKRKLPADHRTVAEYFRDEGFKTGLFSGNGFLTETYDMTRGFETAKFVRSDTDRLFDSGIDPVEFLRDHKDGFGYDDVIQAVLDGPAGRNFANFVYYKLLKKWRRFRYGTNVPLWRWDDEVAKQAGSFIRERADQSERFFVFVNLIEPHAPWQFNPDVVKASGVEPAAVAPHERWETAAEKSGSKLDYASGALTIDEMEKKLLTRLYESWVHRADSVAAEILQVIENSGLADDTLVIVTSDHGEVIASEGDMGHTTSVNKDVAHVPLAMAGPGISPGTVTDPVSLKDLFGTVIKLAGISKNYTSWLDQAAEGRALIETDGPHRNQASEYKKKAPHLWGKKRALYTMDGWVERHYFQDKVRGDVSLVDELDEFVENLEAADGVDVETMDPRETEVGDHLEDLGYLD